ncbi:MAG: peptidoglycan-binding protein [Lysobacteraceae bacterium]
MVASVQVDRTHNAPSPLSNGGGQGLDYTVQRGDTLSGIAARFGVAQSTLLAANQHIRNPDLVYAGDVLSIPGDATRSYTVAPGDTLSAIAQRNGTTVATLVNANGIANPDRIFPGQTLVIPTGSTPGAPTPPPSPGPAPVQPVAPPESPAPAPAPAPEAGRFDYDMISGVRGNANVTPAFIAEVEAMAQRLDTRPEYLMAVMSFETGGSFSPSVVNPVSGATGLIQFIGPTARGLGTSTDALARMSPVEQLGWVERYFDQYPGQLGTLEGVYTSVLSGRATPDPDATLRTPAGREFVRGNIEYTQNAGLDFDNDGRITAGEATQAVAARLYGGVGAVQRQLVEAGAVPAEQRAGFVDNQFGPLTSQAVARFQAAEGLPATGLLDDATGRALFGLAGGDGANPVPEAPGEPAPGLQPQRLARGDQGDAVLAMQNALVSVGVLSANDLATGPGTFGPRTEAAVRSFQRATELSPSGVFDNATRAALASITGGVGVDRNPNTDVVGAVQGRLVDSGHLDATAARQEAGRFGPATEAAVRAFQSENGVEATGIVGATTFDALRRAGGDHAWPVPGFFEVNRADKPGEGEGEFGTFRAGGRSHLGIDLNAPVGTPIVAFREGEVIFADTMRGYGNTVIIQHADGLQTLYAHLDRLDVSAGQTVGQGEQVATLGRTGNVPAAGDTHLHFEIRENANGILTGTPVNPRNYLDFPN